MELSEKIMNVVWDKLYGEFTKVIASRREAGEYAGSYLFANDAERYFREEGIDLARIARDAALAAASNFED